MEKIPKVIMDAGIFKPGDVYIFSNLESPEWEADPINVLYTICSEEDILLGLQFDINFMGEEELKEILTCTRISDNIFKLTMRVHQREEGEVEQKIYMHRILTVRERIAEGHQLYSKD